MDLRLFQAVGQLGNITRAAQAQHLSLAAASARIKAMESHAGVTLLVRQARGVQLTPAGEAFLHHIRAMLRQSELLRSELGEYQRGLRGHVRVLANTTGVSDILPAVLPAFLKANPQVNVELRELGNEEIAGGVREGDADVGIVSDQVDTTGLRSIHFTTDRLVLVVPTGHRFSGLESIQFVQTLDEDHVGMHAGSTLQLFLAGVTARMGRSRRLRVELSSFDAVCRVIGAGVGIGVVPFSSASRYTGNMNIALVELADPWRIRKRHALLREGEEPPAYAQALVDALVRHYRDMPEATQPTGSTLTP